MKVHNRKPHALVMKLAFLMILFLSGEAMALGQQILFPDVITSNPSDGVTDVGRQKGRRGLLFRFKFRNGTNPDDDSAFPLDMSGASVTLTIGTGSPLPCTPG